MSPLTNLFRRRATRRRQPVPLRAEALEPRALLATFSVTSLLDSGAGSLRAAINQANATPGADEIVFEVAGTIGLSSALPVISDTVSIAGSTAPGFAGAPEVTINFRGRSGLRFGPGSDGSSLTSLSLVRASGAGVTLDASGITLAGNMIGVLPDGTTAAGNTGAGVLVTSRGSANRIGTADQDGGNLISGNRGAGVQILGDDNVVAWNLIGTTITAAAALPNGGDGVRLEAGATGNLVGHADPVTSIDYFNTSEITADTSLPVQSWTGIRGLGDGVYLITGSTESDDVTSGLLYVGPLDGDGGAAYAINYPGAESTSVYGPDYLGGGVVRLVGTYVLDGVRYGFAFEGELDNMEEDAADPANYAPILINSEFNYVHSTMGGLAVGNDIATTSETEAGRAYIYDFDSEEFTDIVFPGSISNTAYGIWWNGGTSYTIAGGFSQLPVNNADDRLRPIGMASLIDYDRESGRFSNWRAFSYQSADQVTAATHFMGISSVEKGVYTLSGSGFVSGEIVSSGLATVVRQTDGSFGDMAWVNLAPPESVTGTSGLVSANSVYGNAVVGIVMGESTASYQARVNVGFRPSNVISGNRGNGVAIMGGTDNVVAMNLIGTAFSGQTAVPNGGNGILVTNRAAGNLIGGFATGGNDPTDGVFVRPPQGNLISGNRANGVLITGGATATTLAGNFVGTTASGNTALGNAADGVAIVRANGNSLLGTTFQQSPFVFYNVLSGNAGNGLRVTDSNDTIVQANFTGVGADNATVVANQGSGILVSGRSANTLVGGPIPLGNVNSGNNRYGIEVAGRASGFVAFNSFVGMVAFGGAAPNRLDGIHITSTGGNNLIRTCLVAGNFGNGIVIAGRATGVTVEDTAAGTNASISAAIPNYGSGILITGLAQGNAIGGFQPSVETKVHLSGNLRYGLEITGQARNNRIFNTVIGAGFIPDEQIPNALGGIFLGPGTRNTSIGGGQPAMANRVLFNGGAGITIAGAKGGQILGNEIRANAGSGIVIGGGSAVAIGGVNAGNAIVSNGLNGIQASGGLRGTAIVANTITGNAVNGLFLNAAQDLAVGGTLPGTANTIVTNAGYGLLAVGPCSRTRVIRNLIGQNTLGNVDLSSATGITYLP